MAHLSGVPWTEARGDRLGVCPLTLHSCPLETQGPPARWDYVLIMAVESAWAGHLHMTAQPASSGPGLLLPLDRGDAEKREVTCLNSLLCSVL